MVESPTCFFLVLFKKRNKMIDEKGEKRRKEKKAITCKIKNKKSLV